MSEFKQQVWSMDMLPKDILIDKIRRLEQALEEIKEIAQYNVYTPHTDLCIKLNWVMKKISEVMDD